MYMRGVFMLFFVTATFLHMAAQQNPFRVNSVQGDTSGFWKSIFKYPQFVGGTVINVEDKCGTALLNYNRLSGQVLFINASGDTLEFANPNLIRVVSIGNDTFRFFQNGFLETITHNGNAVNLYKKEMIRYSGSEKKGGYGAYSPATAANSLEKVSSGNNIENLRPDENALYVPQRTFYLFSQPGKFYAATKKNFERLFPARRNEIEDFFKKQKVEFSNGEDLVALLQILQN